VKFTSVFQHLAEVEHMEALYRKYRPTRFSEIVGQEHIKRLLKNALEKRRISHAYIFAGPRGTGKTTTARIIAKSLNCEKNQYGEPCNECVSCKAIDSGSHLDVIELDAASNRGIDEVRRIRDGVNFTPVMGKYKVYIIDEVHMLTKEAFNALLKTLEEPPEHVVFILATTNPEKIPPTIISRCQVLEFRNISNEEIKNRLREICIKEGYDVTEDALEKIVKKAAGGLRDALSILEQVVRYSGGEVTAETVNEALGLVSEETIDKFIEAIITGNLESIESIIDEVYTERGDFDTFLTQVMEKLLEKKSGQGIKLASEIYRIQKELKLAEEKLLLAKVLLINLALPSTKAIGTTTLEVTSTVSAKGERITSNNQVTNEKQALTPTEHDRKVGGNNQEKEEVIEVTQPRVEMPLEQSGDVKQEENTRESPKLVEFSTSDKKDVEHSASENASQLNQTFVTKEILEELKLNGDLSIFVGLSLATVYELDDVVRIVFDKSKQFSYEVMKEKKDQIALLYQKKSGKNREVVVELSDDEHDPVLEKLKILLTD
jgi:DNA polymerase-3 subunit gamma/tau